MKISPFKVFALTTSVIVAVSTCGLLVDAGRFGTTFERGGLPAFATMRSILVIEIGLLVAFSILLPVGYAVANRRRSPRARKLLRISSVCAVLGVVGYFSAVVGIGDAARAGEFGIGAAGVLGIFVFLPSIGLLLMAIMTLILGYRGLAMRDNRTLQWSDPGGFDGAELTHSKL